MLPVGSVQGQVLQPTGAVGTDTWWPRRTAMASLAVTARSTLSHQPLAWPAGQARSRHRPKREQAPLKAAADVLGAAARTRPGRRDHGLVVAAARGAAHGPPWPTPPLP